MQKVTNLQKIETVTNKKGKIVVVKNNKNKFFDNETVKKLIKSEEDIERGRTKKATKVIKELREKYGF